MRPLADVQGVPLFMITLNLNFKAGNTGITTASTATIASTTASKATNASTTTPIVPLVLLQISSSYQSHTPF